MQYKYDTPCVGNNNLTGAIPSELGSIPTLEGLHLCQNNLQGAVPEEIIAMVTLTDLDLCHNELSGQIPSGILSASKSSRLSNSSLQSLNLSELTYFADIYD